MKHTFSTIVLLFFKSIFCSYCSYREEENTPQEGYLYNGDVFVVFSL